MSSGSPLISESARTEIERFLEGWLEDENVPGVSVAVFDEETIVYRSGLGARDLEPDAPVTPETLFAVGSVTKPVTAIAVLQLVDRGVLDLDDEISQYVSVLNDVPGEPIQIHELLSHSSGLPCDYVAQIDRIDDGREWSLLEHIENAAAQRLTDRPRYMYSNSGYFVLAEIIEDVDGRPYPKYVEAEIFDPLGMTRSTFETDALETDDDAMTGYRRTDDGLSPGELEPGAGAAGGLLSPVTELASVGQCVLTKGSYDGNRILSDELVEEMCRYQSPLLPSADDTKRGYGYGWELSEFLDETLVAHRGGIGISGGYMGILRKHGLGVAMAYNALGQPTIPIGKGVLATACGEDRSEGVPILGTYDVIDSVCGTYTAYRDATTVTVEEGPAATIGLTIEERGMTFTANPDSLDGDADTFSQTMGGGVKWVAEFRTTESPVELILSLGKWTFHLTKRDPDDRQ